MPINIANSIDESLAGAAGIIDYSDYEDMELIDIVAGEFFDEPTYTHFYNNLNNKTANFCVFIEHNIIPKVNNNTVAYLLLTSNQEIKNIPVRDFVGFDAAGLPKSISQCITSIDLSDNNELSVLVADEKLFLRGLNQENGLIVVSNYMGQIVAQFDSNNDNIYDISNLASGVYFVSLQSNKTNV